MASPNASDLHLAGLKALENGKIDVAYDLARQAMRMNDKDPQILYLMAMVLAERKRFPEAIEMLEEVAETTPDARLPALGQTADWHVRFGQWAQAESKYREIIKQIPKAAMPHRQLASLLMRQGRRVEAWSHLYQLCQIGDVTENELRSMLATSHRFVGDRGNDPFEPIGPLGVARQDIAKGDWNAARDRLEAMKSRGPWESALLGRTLAVLGDDHKLRRWLIDTDASVNVSPDAWFAKGIYADHIGQPKDAIRCFVEALILDPTDADAYAGLIQSQSHVNPSSDVAQSDVVRHRAGLLKMTQELGAKMARSDDRDLPNLLSLAQMLDQLGRPFEALGWKGVWLSYATASGSVSETEATLRLNEMVADRKKLSQTQRTQPSNPYETLGVDLKTLPSIQEIDKRLASSHLPDEPSR